MMTQHTMDAQKQAWLVMLAVVNERPVRKAKGSPFHVTDGDAERRPEDVDEAEHGMEEFHMANGLADVLDKEW